MRSEPHLVQFVKSQQSEFHLIDGSHAASVRNIRDGGHAVATDDDRSIAVDGAVADVNDGDVGDHDRLRCAHRQGRNQ